MDNIILTEYYRPSSSGEGDIFSCSWKPLPDVPVKGVVQIAHGMNEHSGRYDDFARVLAMHGYAVYANDHIGHGKSALSHPGTFSMKGAGFEFLIQDMHSLMNIMQNEYPGLPRILIGHSMGSIAAGLYPSRYKETDALVLLGMPAQNAASVFGITIGERTARKKGAEARSGVLSGAVKAAMGSFSKRFSAPLGALSRDKKRNETYMKDPLRGKGLSASAFAQMLRALRELGSDEWPYSLVHIPVFIAAGSDDPIGGCGKGPKFYYSRLRAIAHPDVTLRLFPNARHELLNDINRKDAEKAIISFIDEKISD